MHAWVLWGTIIQVSVCRVVNLSSRPNRHSLQGNCSDPDAAGVLDLSAGEASDLLPLKPRQCVVIVAQPFLMSNGGNLWMDGLYLRAMRSTVSPEGFAFIRAGHESPVEQFGVDSSRLYLSNLTLQSEGHKNAMGLVLGHGSSSAVITGALCCVPTLPQASTLGTATPCLHRRRLLATVARRSCSCCNLAVHELLPAPWSQVPLHCSTPGSGFVPCALLCLRCLTLRKRADSIFSDWAGFMSPLRINARSVANVRNTVFRNMQLSVEIADVSQTGTARFENVSFANVTLQHGAVVSTSFNDYTAPAAGYEVVYYAEDDANYDVEVRRLPHADAGVFGAEFVIDDDYMSDCIYMWAYGVEPGCPEESVQQRDRLKARSQGNHALIRVLPEDYGEVNDIGSAPGPAGEDDATAEYIFPEDYAQHRFKHLLLTMDDPWIKESRSVLPPALQCLCDACLRCSTESTAITWA